MRRRLRWTLPLSTGRCCGGCKQQLDALGDRAAACPRSGRIKLRATPLERTWARVLRESGARVREHVKLWEMAIAGVSPNDGRMIEVVATGIPFAKGVPCAVDATLVSPIHADGTAWAGAAKIPGVSIQLAIKNKLRTYQEFAEDRCCLFGGDGNRSRG